MDGQRSSLSFVVGVIAVLAVAGVAPAQPAARPPGAAFAPPEAEPQAMPLAADGFCVVTLHDRREWQVGQPQFGAQFDGRQYAFAGPRERGIFMASPASYAPVLSGDCPVTFAESGQRVPGKVQFGVIQGGRIYFFAGDEARSKFVADPARFASADLADGGRCLVSRVEYRREVAGLPETAVLVGGMRRLFAGAYEQRLYLNQPQRYDPASATPAAPAMASVDSRDAAASDGWRPSSPTAGGGPGSESNSKPADKAPVDGESEPQAIASEPAMGGYCPVTLKQKGAWVRGRYDDRAEVGDFVFFTAGPTEREAFLADPAPFMPALGGDCTVSLVDFGEKVRGSTFHAADYQGRLFLFADAERKAAFKAQPQRYASIDLAASGACVVSLKDHGKNTPGFAEHATWYEGLLYRFAGPDEKAKFLAAADQYAVDDEESPIAQPIPQSAVAQ